MLKILFEILLKQKLKKLIRRFEHTKIFFEKNAKFREFDFRTKSKKMNSFKNSLTLKTMTTMCKMRSIEANIEIKIKIVIIAKIDVVKTKFRAKKSKNQKIIISLIFQRQIVLNGIKKNIMLAIASFSRLATNRKK